MYIRRLVDMSDKYFIPTGKLETEKLEILHRVFFEPTCRYLMKVGIMNDIDPTEVVVDVGCGTGEMTAWMYENTKRQILGIDIDPKQLMIAKNKFADAKNPPKFIESDIENIDNLNIKADIVYCRFVLHHLLNPEIGLDNLVRMTNTNGRIVIGEPIIDGRWIYPHCDEYHEMYDLHLKNTQEHHWQSNYGMKLISELSKRSDLKLIQFEHYRPILKCESLKRYHLIVLELLKDQFLEKKLVNEHHLNQLRDKVEEIVMEKQYTTDLFGLVLVCLEKIK